jgi:cyclic pyranopterin monophosphate synthase
MLSHIDERGAPRMVDIGDKSVTARTAHARARLALPKVIADALRANDGRTAKGSVFDTAVVAGVMGAKRTHELIPFCHPLGLEDCKIEMQLTDDDEVVIDCRVAVHHKTGVEMEALTGASVAALTVYDMCKGGSHDMVLRELRLIEKRGGKHDYEAQP